MGRLEFLFSQQDCIIEKQIKQMSILNLSNGGLFVGEKIAENELNYKTKLSISSWIGVALFNGSFRF